jgi:O-antigen/teichoic acid export membrane protein
MTSWFADAFPVLRRNSLHLLGGRVSAQALALLFVALAARRLGPADFGQFTVAAVVVLIGNTFTTFGTDTLLIRELAKAGRVTHIASRALTLQWCSPRFGSSPRSSFEFPPHSPSTRSACSRWHFSPLPPPCLRAFERMDLFWVASLIHGAVQVIAALLARDVLTLCAFLIVGHTLTALLTLWMCSASLPGFSLLPRLDFRPLLKLTLPFAALTTLSILSQRFGVLSVAAWIDDSAAGLFSTAARVLEGLKLGHFALLGALLPALSRGIQHPRRTSLAVLSGLLVVSALLGGTVTVAARPILLVLFGEAYLSAVPLLVILIWSLVPYSVSAWLSVEMVARGKERALLTATALSLPLTALLFFGLIERFDLVGAAWAVLISEVTQAGILIFVQRRSRQ